MNTDKFYQIALTLVPNVGDVAAKKLLAYCGSAENVFKESRKSLMSIPGIGSVIPVAFSNAFISIGPIACKSAKSKGKSYSRSACNRFKTSNFKNYAFAFSART